ncbi:MAG: Yip1 family protein [Pseudomonadota bacterium]
MALLHLPHMPHYEGWDTLARSHISVLKLFLLYALPLSVLPPVMLHYSGIAYGGDFILPILNGMQLQAIGVIFFVTELVMTFLIAYIIQRLSELVDIKPAFEDAYKLAVVVPTPLWLASLFLFIPSYILILTAGSAAMIISGVLIYYCVPSILKVEEKGHAMLLSGSILSAGLVGWAAVMYLTLITWHWVSSSMMFML